MLKIFDNFYFQIIIPLLLSGLIHHWIIIKYDIFPRLAKPINNSVFGKSKTYRGILVMVILNAFFSWLLFDIPAILGVFIGLGYSLAELPTSFLKRRFGIASSQQTGGLKGLVFYFLEQIDSVLGSLLVISILWELNFKQGFIFFITGSGLHAVIDTLLYFKGYKKELQKPLVIRKLLNQKDRPKQE